MGTQNSGSRHRVLRSSDGPRSRLARAASRPAGARVLAARAGGAARSVMGTAQRDAARFEIPAWAKVNERRRGHILRVTQLLAGWAEALKLPDDERAAWIDAGL